MSHKLDPQTARHVKRIIESGELGAMSKERQIEMARAEEGYSVGAGLLAPPFPDAPAPNDSPAPDEGLRAALVEIEHYLDEETSRAFSQKHQARRVGDAEYERLHEAVRAAYSDATLKVRAALHPAPVSTAPDQSAEETGR